MTRVWLERWEWECCGDPFTIGDEVDFGIQSRTPRAFLADTLSEDVISTVDAIESHHESEFSDRVRGRVTAMHAVTHAVTERRTLRRPGHGAPPDAVMPADGEQWPMVRRELGNGVFAGSQPSRYITESVPVPHSAALESVSGLGQSSEPLAASRPGYRFAGWLIDVDES